MVATLGGFMQATAQGWLVLELTNSPALLGLAGSVAGLPTLFLAVVAGVFADRVDRRRLLVLANLAGAACAGSLAVLTSLGIVAYWHVLVLAFLAGLALTVQMPASQAVVSTIVDRRSIGNAVALNSAQYNLMRIMAPAAAGLFIAAGNLALGFWVNAIALVIVSGIIASLAIPSPRAADRVQAALWLDLQDGIRFVAANRVLAIVVVLPAVPALFVLNYLTFIPVYARDILATGPIGLGLLVWLHVSRVARPALLPPRGLLCASMLLVLREKSLGVLPKPKPWFEILTTPFPPEPPPGPRPAAPARSGESAPKPPAPVGERPPA